MWNWQHIKWPNFNYNIDELWPVQALFEHESGIFVGASQHLTEYRRQELFIELLTQDATSTAEIEGQILDRDSVQSSIQRRLGLKASYRSGASEAGIAELMVDLYQNTLDLINDLKFFSWHQMIMNGRRDLLVGSYRDHSEPMQIVSGPIGRETVHYEAPPSSRVVEEMEGLISWINQEKTKNLPSILAAGIAHLWFESIHPFEDGNGRIGRALAEKMLAKKRHGDLTLTLLSPTIIKHKKSYYEQLHKASRSLDIDDWLRWFACIVIEAQRRATTSVQLTLEKHQIFSKYCDLLNDRQKKALSKLYDFGIEGFQGGLSASNYINITGATQPTATRDLQALTEVGMLIRTGAKKSTRYWLNTSISPIKEVSWEELRLL